MNRKKLVLEQVKDMLKVNDSTDLKVNTNHKEHLDTEVISCKELINSPSKKITQKLIRESTTAKDLLEKYKSLYDKVEADSMKCLVKRSAPAATSPFNSYLTKTRRLKMEKSPARRNMRTIPQESSKGNIKAQKERYYIGPAILPSSSFPEFGNPTLITPVALSEIAKILIANIPPLSHTHTAATISYDTKREAYRILLHGKTCVKHRARGSIVEMLQCVGIDCVDEIAAGEDELHGKVV